MFDTKIELNWSVSPNSTNLKKTVNKISLKDVPSSEGGEVVANLGQCPQFVLSNPTQGRGCCSQLLLSELNLGLPSVFSVFFEGVLN